MISPPTLAVEHCRYGSRETTEGTEPLIPELRLAGHVRYHTARRASFFHHRHAHVLEIFYVVQGKVTWWVDGVSTDVHGNELFLVWPDEWHGARDHIVEPAEYYWVQVCLPLLLPDAGGESFERLRSEADGAAPPRKLTAARALLPLYQSLLHEHAVREICGDSVARETLHLLLALVGRYARVQETTKPAEGVCHAKIERAIRQASQNVRDATLPDMVQSSGLDAATFRKHFCALTGLSPLQYLTRLRLQNAKERMARGTNVTEIAHELGFSSSQYFATVFRKYEGLTPSEFRRRYQKERRNAGRRRELEHR